MSSQTSNLYVDELKLVPTPTLPSDPMRSFSVAVLSPSLVVLNVIYPGESEVVGDAC